MLKIKKDLIDRLRRPQADIGDVQAALKGAVLLELSTIPPYLTALFSIATGTNNEARTLVHSIVIEEMLHMTLAANTLIAIGGHPDILQEGMNLHYPGPLPMCIDEELTVTLGPLTKKQVHDVFMAIERPDTKATLPDGKAFVLPGETVAFADAQASYESIGDFYDELIKTLRKLGPGIFGNPRLEQQVNVNAWFQTEIKGAPEGKVSSMESAEAVLNTIVRQGEGIKITSDPIDPYGGGTELAHYFRFGEIYYGRRLQVDKGSVSGWSYSGAEVPLDERNIVNVLPNAAVSSYEPTSGARISGAQFFDAYRRLLSALDETFNGNPGRLDAALGIMFELKLVAQQVMQFPVDNSMPQVYAAPPFMFDLEGPKRP